MVAPSQQQVPKQLDRSKTAFLTQNSQNESVSNTNAAEEISQLRQKAVIETGKVEEVEEKQESERQSYQPEEIYENYEQIQSSRQQHTVQVCISLIG